MRYGNIHKLLGRFVLMLMVITLASCLKDLKDTLEKPPAKLEWNPEIAFPLGEESFGINDILGFDTSLLRLDTITNIPRWVDEFAIEIIMEGSIDFDLSSYNENPDQINSILMRINVFNGYPDDMQTQAYFLNSDQVRVDSMFDKGPLEISGGTITDNGASIDPTHAREDAIFDKENFSHSRR